MSILNMLHSGERLERPANSACPDELLVLITLFIVFDQYSNAGCPVFSAAVML